MAGPSCLTRKSSGPKVTVVYLGLNDPACCTVVVAADNPTAIRLIVSTLRTAGYGHCHAYDGVSVVKLAAALRNSHLLITNSRVGGMPGVELIRNLRRSRPRLPAIHIGSIDYSTPDIEAWIPSDVPILRVPFSADELLILVQRLASPTSAREVN
jgi:CheY-like chemotaxis protein